MSHSVAAFPNTMHSGSPWPIRQPTSLSETGLASADDMLPTQVMELTSPSEIHQSSPCGCSLAQGCGRGNSPNQHDNMEEETYVSEETARIAAAAKRTKWWDADAKEDTTSSEEGLTAPVASDSGSMPNSSGVFDDATWLVNRLTEEQRQKRTRHFSWMDLCAGLGTPLSPARPCAGGCCLMASVQQASARG